MVHYHHVPLQKGAIGTYDFISVQDKDDCKQ